MTELEQTDVVVVGMGPGGEYVAETLADAGLDVTGVESRLLGGECPYYGCVPTKMMIRAANLIAETRRAPILAGSSTMTPDWSKVALRIREEATDYWDDKVAVDRFTGKGGHFVRGFGKITAPGEVTVEVTSGQARVFRPRKGIVIATGTDPAIPPIEGLAGTPFWTNRDIVQAEQIPESLVILGGGAIGCELAQAFARFGASVTVVEAQNRLLSFEEPEACALIERVFTAEGITVCMQRGRTGQLRLGPVTVHIGDSAVTAERLLVATGRRVNLSALGVAAVGIDEHARAIPTDGWMRAAEGVWALGDITGKGAFTHMSMYQGDIVVRDILGQGGGTADYRAVPRVTFTDPEVGSVGLTEEQARAAGLDVRVGITQVPDSARGWIHKAGNDGFIKVVQDAGRGVLVGATSAGPVGGEVLSALQVAIRAEVPVATLRNMPYTYPTFYRAIEDALKDLR